MSVSEGIEYRRKTEANKNDATITVTTNTTTKTKILTPFQAERVLLISKLRELSSGVIVLSPFKRSLVSVKDNTTVFIRRHLSMTASL
ncbi:MAG: hypothetical protein M3288_06745 [Thermoproteota archaeon]|nr:hypothetical protein [Thermoproteota archaeon]